MLEGTTRADFWCITFGAFIFLHRSINCIPSLHDDLRARKSVFAYIGIRDYRDVSVPANLSFNGDFVGNRFNLMFFQIVKVLSVNLSGYFD